jgi:hypothetical protein
MKRILFILFLSILLIGNISAFNFDNQKVYDEETKTATIINSFGFGKTIATAKLDTQQIVYLMPGKDRKFAEITINSNEDYKNFLEKIELINKRNGKEFSRDITFKYKLISECEKEVQDRIEDCSTDKNNSLVCKEKIIGSHKEKTTCESWIPLDKLEFKKGKITIGLFTDVEKGDYVEWIPTIFGTEIEEWAAWTDSFNVGLVSGYNMEEISGNLISDVVIGNLADNTMVMTKENRTASGKIGKAVGFVGNNRSINSSPQGFQTGNQNISVSFWAKRTGTGKGLFSLGEGGEGTYLFIAQDIVSYGGGANDLALSIMPSANTWYHIVLITNTAGNGNITVWQNGVWNAGKINSAPNFNFNKILVGFTSGVGYYMDGFMDEVYIWNRTLTSQEITDLYNGGSGITYIVPFSISSSLNSPVDYFNTTFTVNFSATANAVAGNVTNMTLYIWGTTTTTNITTGLSGLTNDSSWIMSGFTDGSYLWNVKSCAENSTFANCTFAAANRTFTIDNTPPTIIINSGNGTQNYGDLSTNHTINYTITDTKLQSCWLDYNRTNTTIPCTSGATNTTNFQLEYGNYSAILWANDSVGNLNYTTFSWDYVFFYRSNIYNLITYETESEYFEINITTSQNILSQSGKLVYNGTEYIATSSCSVGLCSFKTTLDLPLITSGETQNKSFYWNLTLYNGSTSYSLQTSTLDQQISRIRLAECNATFNISTFNFTAWDEQSLLRIKPFSFDGTFDIWLGNGNIKRSYSITNKSGYERNLCIFPYDKTIKVEGEIEYAFENSTLSYVSRNYFFQNNTIKNVTQNISLYLLDVEESTTFILKVQDLTLKPVEDAIIYVQRYYPSDGTYKNISISKTDSNGKTTAFFETETVDYRFLIMKNGEVLLLTDKRKVVGETVPYTLTFTVGTQLDYPWAIFEKNSTINSTLTYDKDLSLVTFTYIDLTGGVSIGRLLVIQQSNTNSSFTVICNTTSSESSATLTCDVSSYEGVAIAYGILNEQTTDLLSFIITNVRDIFGKTGLILGLFIIMVAGFAFIWNPTAGIIAINAAIIFTNIIGFIALSPTFIGAMIFLSFIGIILMKT